MATLKIPKQDFAGLDPDSREHVTACFREFLRRSDWKLADISRKTGVPYRTLQNWRHGINQPLLEQAIRVASIMDVSLDDMFRNVGSENKRRQERRKILANVE